MTKLLERIGHWIVNVCDKDLEHAIQYHQSLAQVGSLGITAGIALLALLVSNTGGTDAAWFWGILIVIGIVLPLSAFILFVSLKNLSRYPRTGSKPLS